MGRKKTYTLFPFKTTLDYIQRDVVALIQSPDYQFELPEISPQLWRQMNWDHSVAERLEFLGDSLMHSHFSDGLNKHFPYETPGFYTRVRSVLEANSTFAHLMIKVGSSTVDSPVKAAGDIFESIMAAFHREQGAEVFGQYFRKYFTALILQAGHAFKVYQSMLWKFPGKDRPRAPKLHLQHSMRHGKNIQRRLATKVLQRKVARKASIIAREARLSSEIEKLKITEVIDLTKDNDSDGVEMLDGPSSVAPQLSTNQTQMSLSNLPQVIPAHHMSPLGAGPGHVSQPTQSEMKKGTPLVNNRRNVEDRRSDESLPRPSRPHLVLNSASVSSGPGYSQPRGLTQGPNGSRSGIILSQQPQSASNIGSIENPIVIN